MLFIRDHCGPTWARVGPHGLVRSKSRAQRGATGRLLGLMKDLCVRRFGWGRTGREGVRLGKRGVGTPLEAPDLEKGRNQQSLAGLWEGKMERLLSRMEASHAAVGRAMQEFRERPRECRKAEYRLKNGQCFEELNHGHLWCDFRR